MPPRVVSHCNVSLYFADAIAYRSRPLTPDTHDPVVGSGLIYSFWVVSASERMVVHSENA